MGVSRLIPLFVSRHDKVRKTHDLNGYQTLGASPSLIWCLTDHSTETAGMYFGLESSCYEYLPEFKEQMTNCATFKTHLYKVL